MGQPEQFKGGFLKALIKDPTANTIAIGAASLVPLVAMVGGGVDASRFYMAQSRLQAACDAGALGARRAMDDLEFTNEIKAIGDGFFEENFPAGTFGTENLTHAYTATNDGEVNGTASGKIPTSLMAMFGYEEFNLNVTCSADINISNTDVVMVLDVTGSMAGDRLLGLQNAAKDFYEVVEDATSASAQVRYGFVPYNTNVNVGKVLYAANPSWLATTHKYSSREPQYEWVWYDISFETTNYYNAGNAEKVDFSTTAAGHVSEGFCAAVFDQYASGYDPFIVDGSLDTSTADTTQSMNGNFRTTQGTGAAIRLRYGVAGYEYDADDIGPNGRGYCRVGNEVWEQDAVVDFTEVEERREEFDEYRYYRKDFTLTGLYDDDSITFNTGFEGADEAHSWDGCIEAAGTDEGQTDFTVVSNDAHDLNVNLIPQTEDEKWKPSLPSLVYYRYTDVWSYNELYTENDLLAVSDTSNYTCPREAQRLAEMTKTEFDTYIDSLWASGFTYHDGGMIWGARFISPNGIFSAQNTSSPNGEAISRHIVFMTDGGLDVENEVYTRYGIEFWDRRVTTDGSEDTQFDNHAARFQAACRAARNENVSVWVVAFGTTLTQNLIDCATPGRAYEASNSQALSDAFKEIAEKIAALRLTS